MVPEYSKKKDLNVVVFVTSVVILLLLTVGYAIMEQEYTISGEAIVKPEQEARISAATYSESVYGQENYSPTFTKDTLTTSVTLSQLNGSVSYVLTLRNLGNVNMNIISSSFTSSDNPNITYTLSEPYPVSITAGTNNKQIIVTFSYKEDVTSLPVNTTLVSTIKFNFSSTVCTSNTIKQTYSVGDVVAICNTTTGKSEDFYVLSDDGINITALAKYRLYVGSTYKNNPSTSNTSDMLINSLDEEYGLQSQKTTIVSEDGYDISSAYIYFLQDNNSTPYWVENNLLKNTYGNSYPAFVYDNNSFLDTYLQTYLTYISTLSNDNTITISLVNLDDLINLGCTSSTCATQSVTENSRTWLYETGTYWTGNAYDNSSLYYVNHDGTISNGLIVRAGIRPVITMAKTSIK